MARQKADKSPPKSDESAKPQPIVAGSHPIDMLKADPDNPREIGDEALAGLAVSLEEFGDLSGIVYNSGTGELIAGHQRVRTLREAGATEFVRSKGIGPGTDVARGYVDHPTTGERFDVRFVNWTRGKQRQANVVANSRAIAGRFTEGVDTILSQFQESDPDLFGALRMDHLKAFEFNELPAIAVDGAPPAPAGDDVPEIPEGPPDSVLGQVYELGPHRLFCGDSTDSGNIALLMNGQQADLFLTDIPYGVSYADKNVYLNAIAPGNRIQVPIEGDHQTLDEMFKFWMLAFKVALDVTKPGGCYYLTGPQGGDLLLLLLQAIGQSGWLLKHMLIWVKNNHVLGRCDFNYKHEPILYGWKPGAGHYFDASPGECSSTWFVDKPHSSKEHPTMKPVALFTKAILHGSRLGELVLDTFLGSGTTLLSCAETGRICRGAELSPAYCDVIRRRWTRYAAANGIAAGPGALAELTPANG